MAERRYTPNGVRIYADFFDTYGRTVRVRQSSSATEDRVWLDVGEDNGHLNADQARQVITSLTEWLAEVHPEANPGRRLTEEPAAGDRGDSRVAGLGEWVQGACGCIWREHRPPGLVIDPAEPRVCSACLADHPASVRPSPQGMAMVPVTYYHHQPGAEARHEETNGG